MLQKIRAGATALISTLLIGGGVDCQGQTQSTANRDGPWRDSRSPGFRAGAQSISIMGGVSGGIGGFGSLESHDLALGSVSYGLVLSGVVKEGRWWQGNWEFRMELFGGAQYSPREDWLVGLTPHLRYNFATGTRFIPFLDAGLGITATSIGEPDLGGVFQFNEQGGGGVHWFFKDQLALTLEARYIHVSNAGIERPNRGLNGVIGLVGVTRFF
jgi:lipid A 3-O-deacylase